jgi:hypothetical protein
MFITNSVCLIICPNQVWRPFVKILKVIFLLWPFWKTSSFVILSPFYFKHSAPAPCFKCIYDSLLIWFMCWKSKKTLDVGSNFNEIIILLMSNIIRVQLLLHYDGICIASFIFFCSFVFLLPHLHKLINKNSGYSETGTLPWRPIYRTGARTLQCKQTQIITHCVRKVAVHLG